MIFGGTHHIPAGREVVWQALMNPEILARALPGCEKLEANPDGSYHAQMKVGVAAIKGTYQGRVEILDPVPYELFRIRVEGKGTGGFLNGVGTLSLATDGEGTLIRYAGEAQVGGLIAGVGQRLVFASAKKIIQQFFEEFSRQVHSAQSPVSDNRPPS